MLQLAAIEGVDSPFTIMLITHWNGNISYSDIESIHSGPVHLPESEKYLGRLLLNIPIISSPESTFSNASGRARPLRAAIDPNFADNLQTIAFKIAAGQDLIRPGWMRRDGKSYRIRSAEQKNQQHYENAIKSKIIPPSIPGTASPYPGKPEKYWIWQLFYVIRLSIYI